MCQFLTGGRLSCSGLSELQNDRPRSGRPRKVPDQVAQDLLTKGAQQISVDKTQAGRGVRRRAYYNWCH